MTCMEVIRVCDSSHYLLMKLELYYTAGEVQTETSLNVTNADMIVTGRLSGLSFHCFFLIRGKKSVLKVVLSGSWQWF